ncbi:hypothetical protein QTP81_09610 [Alteromonas sp. ASW11-36]|uniref:Uncharacterized protein n=1 Tax=Alteromonas arenosi TaxID=3055817 RepID=A0ABT7SXF5_9ALTE|nr:hypothetical protein [Alteromonas sp. ASW11-36]MDM7860851.1 hypothetical protein [Alteromonas sp. ASW11-36]
MKPIFKDLTPNSIYLFVLGLALVALGHNQFMALAEGINPNFVLVLMVLGPGCLFMVSFITTASPKLCRSHLQAYVAFISGVEIGIAMYLGYCAAKWYQFPDASHLEPTVVCLTLVIGCLQWSKSKWEKRVKALIEVTQQAK